MSRPVYMRDQPRQPWRRCPYCGNLHDGMTGVSSRPGAYPEEGVPLICGDCGDWGVLDSKVEGGWRPPTFNERAEMLATFEFMLVLAAVRATIQRRET